MTRTNPDHGSLIASSTAMRAPDTPLDRATGDLVRLGIYVFLTFAITWVIFWPAVRDRPEELLDIGWRFIAVAVPSLVAIAMALLDNAADSTVSRTHYFRRFMMVRIAWWRALCLFYGLAGVLLLVLAAFDPSGVATMLSSPATFLVLAGMPLFAIATQGLGGPLEEAGWRGYALPLMLRMGTPIAASFGLGLIHAAWHMPLFLVTGYPSSDVSDISFSLTLALFFLHVVNVSILLTWVFLNSRGSIGLAVLAHAIVNFTLAGQNIYELVRDEQLSIPFGFTGTVLGAMSSSLAVAILLSFRGPRRQLFTRTCASA